jgi:hypothetical protein
MVYEQTVRQESPRSFATRGPRDNPPPTNSLPSSFPPLAGLEASVTGPARSIAGGVTLQEGGAALGACPSPSAWPGDQVVARRPGRWTGGPPPGLRRWPSVHPEAPLRSKSGAYSAFGLLKYDR